MWPYRPQRLSDILEPAEIEYLLGFGAPQVLRSATALVEAGADDLPRRFDPGRAHGEEYAGPFCSFLRKGNAGGSAAFVGADEACERCEARLAQRALSGTGDEVVRSRCHMGLSDFAAPVVVEGTVLAAVVAGQCVEDEEQRKRIAKTVGKLGKLTRGEVRSLEEAGIPAEAPIRLADERVREMLLREIPAIPLVTRGFHEGLSRMVSMISTLASHRLQGARREWEDDFLATLFPEPVSIPERERGSLEWLRYAVFELRQKLKLEYIAVFSRFPGQLDSTLEFLPLAAQSGLSSHGAADISDDPDTALLELDPRRLASQLRGADQGAHVLGTSTRAASGLISALRSTKDGPAEWKDILTKSLYVAAILPEQSLETVFVFGPSTADTAPGDDDLRLLKRAAERVSRRYRFLTLEYSRRSANEKLRRHEEERRKEEEARAARRKKSAIRPQRFDLHKLFTQCLEKQLENAGDRKVNVDSRGFPDRVMLEADRHKLEAVFDCVLHYALENARPVSEHGGSSVLVSLRRDRRNRSRVHVVFDMLGRFLSSEQRRELLRGRLSASGEPSVRTEDRKAEGGDDAPPARISFKEAQRYLAWHGGSLNLECTRTGKEEGEGGGWLGRSVLTLSFREMPREQQRAGAERQGGKRAERGDEKRDQV